ncbi:MAG: tetratricopeptide repeat protein [Pirellulales bacterium]|nr:tetratricopeptide repeat protein [Pirellulales bacterium]
MPICRSFLLLGLLFFHAGCRLPAWSHPVSRPLATSRQLCQQSLTAVERGQWQEAESLLAQAVKSCPEDPDSRRQYAEVLWHRGAREEAVAQLLEAGEQSPDDASLRVRAAEMQLELGNLELAYQSAQVALELDSNLAGAWSVSARIKRARGMPRQALADFHRALQFDPLERDVLLEVAELYQQMNQPERALVTLQSLADSYPPGEEPQKVLFLEGLACSALGRYDDAVEKFTAAVARDKPTAEILCRLGEAELAAGRPARAAAAAHEAIALAPDYQPGRELMGRIELAMQPGPPRRR